MQRRGGVGLWIVVVLGVLVLGGLALLTVRRLGAAQGSAPASRERGPVPVEVAAVERGPIENRRVFSGSMAATARVDVAPKIGGRIVTLPVDLSDPVTRGQVVATLDRDEHEQLVAQAEADLAVARAGLAEAESARSIAAREFDRIEQLHQQRVVSDSEFDASRATLLAAEAAASVAEARITRAESALESARIRLGYTTVRAEWSAGDDRRLVAERYAEEGDTVQQGEAILTIVDLDPIEVRFFATETDYTQLAPGQRVTLATDAHPGRAWSGEVARIAPVFEEGSRQARVEVRVPNPDGALKPGMFARVEAVLERVEDALTVPEGAITLRGGTPVVFVVDEEASTVAMVPIEPGIRDGGRVQVKGREIEGRVVTLGQQLLGEGSAISIPQPGAGEG